jgi:hypothetical protein
MLLCKECFDSNVDFITIKGQVATGKCDICKEYSTIWDCEMTHDFNAGGEKLDRQEQYDNFIDEQIEKTNNAVIEERIDLMNRIEFLQSELKVAEKNRDFWQGQYSEMNDKLNIKDKQIQELETRPIINLGDEKIADILKIISVELLAKLGIEIAEKDREIEELNIFVTDMSKIFRVFNICVMDSNGNLRSGKQIASEMETFSHNLSKLTK